MTLPPARPFFTAIQPITLWTTPASVEFISVSQTSQTTLITSVYRESQRPTVADSQFPNDTYPVDNFLNKSSGIT